MGLGAGADPEGDGAGTGRELEIVDDEAGLRGAVDVEAGFGAGDLDADTSPDAGLEIDIALVLFGGLFAEAVEVEAGVSAVLGGVVAADLIVGASVGGAEVDVFVGVVGEAKGETDEAAGRGRGGGTGLTGELDLDGAVFEDDAVENGVAFAVGGAGLGEDADGGFAAVGGVGDVDVVGSEVSGALGEEGEGGEEESD